jgi:hypothetical protein
MGTLKDVLTTNIVTKVSTLTMKEKIKDMKHRFDSSEHGGAPLLGISKPVIKAHGSSDAKAVKNAIRQAIFFVNTGMNADITSFAEDYDEKKLIADADKARILELGERIKKNYSNPLKFSGVIQDGNTFTIANKDCDIFFATKNTTFEIVNTVVIEEDLTEGQSIKSFNLYAHLPYDRLSRILVYIGKTVGHKLICRFPAIRSPKITMEVTESDGTVVVKDMKAYFVK